MDAPEIDSQHSRFAVRNSDRPWRVPHLRNEIRDLDLATKCHVQFHFAAGLARRKLNVVIIDVVDADKLEANACASCAPGERSRGGTTLSMVRCRVSNNVEVCSDDACLTRVRTFERTLGYSSGPMIPVLLVESICEQALETNEESEIALAQNCSIGDHAVVCQQTNRRVSVACSEMAASEWELRVCRADGSVDPSAIYPRLGERSPLPTEW